MDAPVWVFVRVSIQRKDLGPEVRPARWIEREIVRHDKAQQYFLPLEAANRDYVAKGEAKIASLFHLVAERFKLIDEILACHRLSPTIPALARSRRIRSAYARAYGSALPPCPDMTPGACL